MFDQNLRAIVDPPVYMNPSDIAAYRPAGPDFAGPDRFAPLRDGLARWGHFGPTQLAGRTFAMACVALEVTQRCNLDCTLCYLSDRAEMAHDVPLGELKRRIKMIRDHYGPHTNVQITGGDPTLRSAEELEAIVSYIRARGLRSALFTNGIRATPALLQRLARSGLDDVAFHVDLTQNRKGYDSEAALNAVRQDYLRRAEGTGLRVQFNTTVFAGNVAEVPDLCRFFLSHADRINLVSFQMQADTGRGTLRARDADMITQQSMIERIRRGLGIALDFDVLNIGHPRCNRYASVLTSGGAVAPLYDDPALAARLFDAVADRRDDWNRDRRTLRRIVRAGLRDPLLGFGILRWAARVAWRLRDGLPTSRGRVHRLSFFIHNFMDATKLERERCDGCVFMAMTADGPLSMCVHNAQRDRYVFQPAPVAGADGGSFWNPATGRIGATSAATPPRTQPPNKLKGRMRARARGGDR